MPENISVLGSAPYPSMVRNKRQEGETRNVSVRNLLRVVIMSCEYELDKDDKRDCLECGEKAHFEHPDYSADGLWQCCAQSFVDDKIEELTDEIDSMNRLKQEAMNVETKEGCP